MVRRAQLRAQRRRHANVCRRGVEVKTYLMTKNGYGAKVASVRLSQVVALDG